MSSRRRLVILCHQAADALGQMIEQVAFLVQRIDRERPHALGDRPRAVDIGDLGRGHHQPSTAELDPAATFQRGARPHGGQIVDLELHGLAQLAVGKHVGQRGQTQHAVHQRRQDTAMASAGHAEMAFVDGQPVGDPARFMYRQPHAEMPIELANPLEEPGEVLDRHVLSGGHGDGSIT